MPSAKLAITTPPSIPAEQVATIKAAIAALIQMLMPYLIDLGTIDRRELAKMGDSNVGFVDRTLAYVQDSPQQAPAFVDPAEFARNFAGSDTLREFELPLMQLMRLLADSRLAFGAEAYATALAVYHAVKANAKAGVPGAAAIAEDLSKQFAVRGGRLAKPAPGTSSDPNAKD